MDVSIIIVNYNTEKLLESCINSIYEKTKEISFEIIIVDNCSSDNSRNLVKTKYPQITLIEPTENLGFGRANNLGAQYAIGKYLFLLNTDTSLINNAIKALFDFMENDDMIGVCGGNLYHLNGKPNFSFANILPSLLSVFLYRTRLLSYIPLIRECYNNKGVPMKVKVIIGADLMIKRAEFYKLGGFDPGFFMYIEDTELCYRVYKSGKQIYSVPDAKIIHLQGKSSNTDQKYFMEVTSYYLYFKKWKSVTYTILYLLEESFFCFLKIVYFLLRFKWTRIKENIKIQKYLVKLIFTKK